jgi:hypothetical protein
MIELTAEQIGVTIKALERYKTRMEEISLMGWYKSSSVTDAEIARINSALAALRTPQQPAMPEEVVETIAAALGYYKFHVGEAKRCETAKAWLAAQRGDDNAG